MSLKSTAGRIAAVLLLGALWLGALPARAGDFLDSAGRHVVLPDRITRVMPAGPTADVLVYVLAPDKLIGWSVAHSRPYLSARGARLPVVGRLNGTSPSVGAEAVIRLRPDIVIDAGAVTPERAAFADRMQQQTGVPYILVDNSIARTPLMLRSVAAVLGVADRGSELAMYAEGAITAVRGRLLIQPADQRPHVYYGRDPSGMQTALPGSPAGAALDEAGALNVAASLAAEGRTIVTPAQLAAWNPDIIIAANRTFYESLIRSPAWRRLAAVRNKRVYLMPRDPFGWIDEPPGVNRLIGLYWLAGLLYPGPTQDDLNTTTPDFYQKFYGVKLTDQQLAAILRPAGVAAPENAMPMANSMLGTGPLGRVPGSTPGTAPAGTPVAPISPGLSTPMNAPGLGLPDTGVPSAGPGGVPGGVPGATAPARRHRQPTTQSLQ